MADQQDPLGVTIGAREIYDELVGMRSDVQALTQRDVDTAKLLADHETRIRAVERWKYGIPGVLALSGVAYAIQIFKG